MKSRHCLYGMHAPGANNVSTLRVVTYNKDADRRSICELTLTSDSLQSKVEDMLLISAVSRTKIAI
jgi:hypothetical protein